MGLNHVGEAQSWIDHRDDQAYISATDDMQEEGAVRGEKGGGPLR